MSIHHPSGRNIHILSREEAMHKFWRAERDAGVDNITATERMGDFAARTFDQYDRDLAIIRSVLERKS